jgi:hypothetical protein
MQCQYRDSFLYVVSRLSALTTQLLSLKAATCVQVAEARGRSRTVVLTDYCGRAETNAAAELRLGHQRDFATQLPPFDHGSTSTP